MARGTGVTNFPLFGLGRRLRVALNGVASAGRHSSFSGSFLAAWMELGLGLLDICFDMKSTSILHRWWHLIFTSVAVSVILPRDLYTTGRPHPNICNRKKKDQGYHPRKSSL